jgi:hypothetical protein
MDETLAFAEPPFASAKKVDPEPSPPKKRLFNFRLNSKSEVGLETEPVAKRFY